MQKKLGFTPVRSKEVPEILGFPFVSSSSRCCKASLPAVTAADVGILTVVLEGPVKNRHYHSIFWVCIFKNAAMNECDFKLELGNFTISKDC